MLILTRPQGGRLGVGGDGHRTPPPLCGGGNASPAAPPQGGFEGIAGQRAAGQSTPRVCGRHTLAITTPRCIQYGPTANHRQTQRAEACSLGSLPLSTILGPQLGGRGEGPREVMTTGKQWWPQVNPCLPEARPGSQCSWTVNSLNPPKNTPIRYWFVIPFYRWGNRGTEQLSDWPESYNR